MAILDICRKLIIAGFCTAVCCLSVSAQTGKGSARIARFEKELIQLQSLLKIPGMSVVVLRDQQVIFSRGFGYSDVEKRVAATPETPYEIASLSKTFGAFLLMQLVEQGKLSLDDPMSKYVDQVYKDDKIKVRHVLTHTSEGDVPGETFLYNGNLFDNLTTVVIKASGKRYRLQLADEILQKIGSTTTAPGNDYGDNPTSMSQLMGEARVKNYLDVIDHVAQPYKLYGDGEVIHTFNPQRGIGTANGIISSVADLAKYDVAIDRDLLVKRSTRDQMWTAAVSNSGKSLPYGLGWMVQMVNGVKLIWHNGFLPDRYSALYLKVPEKNLTLILLANSDAISAPAKLAQANVTNSAFADSFLRTFVWEGGSRSALPTPKWGADAKTFAAAATRTKDHKYDFETAANDALREWLDQRRRAARKIVKVDPGSFDGLAGQYQIGSGAPFTIAKLGDHLIREGRTTFELFPEAENVFFAKAVDAGFTFVKDEKRKVTQIKIKAGDAENIALPVAAASAQPASQTPAKPGENDAVKNVLVDLEKRSWEAWKNRDGKFFQQFLSDDHVELGPGGVTDRSTVVSGVSSPACVVRSYAVDSFSLTMFDGETALLTYHAAQDTTCGGSKVPSPVWVSSLYKKRDGRWLNVAFQQTQTSK